MADAICFWSLLSLQNLDFLHVSPTMGSQTVLAGYDTTIEDLILNQSLLDFIHPDEKLLAKQDLSTFLQRKTLAGAVTRCRLRSFASLVKRGASPSQLDDDKISTWAIVDMVMYIVNEGVVLGFFHNQDNFQKHSTCGESYFTPKDAGQLLTVLQAHQPLRRDFITTPTFNNNNNSNSDSDNTVDRVLQVYDKCSKRRLLSWPPSDQYYNPEDGQHLHTSSLLQPQQPSSSSSSSSSIASQQLHQYHSSVYNPSSCIQHMHSQSVIPHPASTSSAKGSSANSNESYCQLERIVISYGCIIFYSFQISYRPSARPSNQLQATGDFDTRESIDLPHFPDSRKLPQIALPSIIKNNSMSTNIPSIESQHYKYPHLPHHHHPRYVSTPMCQHKKQNKQCARCGTIDSPEWRRGPTGHKTLCNACGLRYSRLMSKKHTNNTPAPRRYS